MKKALIIFIIILAAGSVVLGAHGPNSLHRIKRPRPAIARIIRTPRHLLWERPIHSHYIII